MTRVDGIVAKIAAMIDGNLLKPGERLLSVRAGALEHGVSKNTMAEAYDRLVALGHLEARQGSGYYVARVRRPSPEQRPSHVAEAADFVSLLREQLVQNYAVRIGDGRPPPSWMERFDMGGQPRHTPTASEHGYGNPWGFLPLRERLALTLAERSIKVAPEQILLTQGANHALDLVARQLLEPGDVALVDSPGYYPLFGKLKLAKVEIAGVRRRGDGPDLEELAALAARLKPKVFFTQSLAHNPTGGSITPAVAHRLLQIAEQHGFHVVEDDPFADILPAASPRLATLDQLERVIYVGTFSKTLSASLRVGYVAAKPALINTLCDLKMLTVVSTSDFVERIVYGVIASGQYLRHLRRLKARVEAATEEAVGALGRLGLRMPIPPTGGYYLWGELPEGTEERALVRDAAERGIFLAPGSVFVPGKALAVPAMRINVAYAGDPRFIDFMRDQLGR
ncbi:aminotransferase-like domain-containing protein [Azospirillum rugosum]|uniref:DNA-binding transcriptional MocR family regulator n=1 Tax=Azospirillum rugosum TaxID=416170 RepID=A0ABS4SVT6_9PROT|nr:PLP-dependent aminotransferase family protein [Azospirillum rugosum]MBP2296562.1 DNA-binding transcriptional MocR family regulator [Azospirillum rugosum]MDQ0530038.1 DNA-binding transcriptional MocR family regulator [Azospirillum rugosum]